MLHMREVHVTVHFAVLVHARGDVEDCYSGLHHVGGDSVLCRPDGGDHDVCLLDDALLIFRAYMPMDPSCGGVAHAATHHQHHRLGRNVVASDDHSLLTLGLHFVESHNPTNRQRCSRQHDHAFGLRAVEGCNRVVANAVYVFLGRDRVEDVEFIRALGVMLFDLTREGQLHEHAVKVATMIQLCDFVF